LRIFVDLDSRHIVAFDSVVCLIFIYIKVFVDGMTFSSLAAMVPFFEMACRVKVNRAGSHSADSIVNIKNRTYNYGDSSNIRPSFGVPALVVEATCSSEVAISRCRCA
jgi:hypothetical protein